MAVGSWKGEPLHRLFPRIDLSQDAIYPFFDRPRQAYIFAKYLRLFLEEPYILRSDSGAVEDRVETDVFSKLSEDANVTFLASMAHNVEGLSPPKGIVQLPRLGRTEFREALANNRVVVGLGNPALSPTPWEALCMGVPFINPVFDWDRDHPEDRTKWNAQQNGVMYLCLDEPHVYHVKCGDRAGFEQAVRKAMDSPIDR
ncbi:hypothetical protein FRB96_009153 [Tulasnella sp. 330]|nr:hypothetical protein FRB96_009153 [Tulasnella sp. 330]